MLYRSKENQFISIEKSSNWIRHGNNTPQYGARMFNLQDRNIFTGNPTTCKHCRAAKGTVDHLVTRYDKIFANEYTRRHNEIIKCIQLLICNKYWLKSSKKIRGHSIQQIIGNKCWHRD